VTHTFIYRAAEDAILAPQNAYEDGLRILKRDLAEGIGVPLKNLKQLGEMANVGSGVRHASKTGIKMRANLESYSTWIAGLVDAINFARKEVEHDFVPMTAKEVAESLSVAVKIRPHWSGPRISRPHPWETRQARTEGSPCGSRSAFPRLLPSGPCVLQPQEHRLRKRFGFRPSRLILLGISPPGPTPGGPCGGPS
jgi:hypothetical protein